MQKAIDATKGVKSFVFNKTSGNYELTLDDNTVLHAGHTAGVELRNFDGSYVAGYIHSTPQGE